MQSGVNTVLEDAVLKGSFKKSKGNTMEEDIERIDTERKTNFSSKKPVSNEVRKSAGREIWRQLLQSWSLAEIFGKSV